MLHWALAYNIDEVQELAHANAFGFQKKWDFSTHRATVSCVVAVGVKGRGW
jgi:hypothetical protein